MYVYVESINNENKREKEDKEKGMKEERGQDRRGDTSSVRVLGF